MTERKIALLLMSVSSVIIWELMSRLHLITGKIQTLLVVFSILVFGISLLGLLKDFRFENSYLKLMFPLFFAYSLFIVVRGFSLTYDDVKTYIQSPVAMWPFLLPIFIFFDKKITTLGLLMKWSFSLGFFFLCLAALYPKILFERITAESYISLFIPCGFLLLNATFLPNRKVNLSFLIIFISIVALTYLARRSALFTMLGFVAASYFLNIMNKSRSGLFRFFPLIVVIGLFIMFSRYFDTSRQVLFDKMNMRITEDTRSGLFTMFFYDMRDDMLLGKGMNGTYYFPMRESQIDGEVFGAVEYRSIIENGYFQLLLNGGIVQIVLFLLVLFPAAILGLFFSSNQFVKACGAMILLRLIDMLLFGLPSFSLHYIFIWICAGVCYKTSLRKLTNEDFRKEFKKIELA